MKSFTVLKIISINVYNNPTYIFLIKIKYVFCLQILSNRIEIIDTDQVLLSIMQRENPHVVKWFAALYCAVTGKVAGKYYYVMKRKYNNSHG